MAHRPGKQAGRVHLASPTWPWSLWHAALLWRISAQARTWPLPPHCYPRSTQTHAYTRSRHSLTSLPVPRPHPSPLTPDRQPSPITACLQRPAPQPPLPPGRSPFSRSSSRRRSGRGCGWRGSAGGRAPCSMAGARAGSLIRAAAAAAGPPAGMPCTWPAPPTAPPTSTTRRGTQGLWRRSFPPVHSVQACAGLAAAAAAAAPGSGRAAAGLAACAPLSLHILPPPRGLPVHHRPTLCPRRRRWRCTARTAWLDARPAAPAWSPSRASCTAPPTTRSPPTSPRSGRIRPTLVGGGGGGVLGGGGAGQNALALSCGRLHCCLYTLASLSFRQHVSPCCCPPQSAMAVGPRGGGRPPAATS
jgi:hypothetical protein